MKKLIISTVAILGFFIVSLSLARAQIAPEQHQLAMFFGEWSYEGTAKDTVLGPGGHYAGKATDRFTMDGLFLESHGRDTGVLGGKEVTWEGMSMRWYDSATQQYKTQGFNNEGLVSSLASQSPGGPGRSRGQQFNRVQRSEAHEPYH